MSVPTVDEDAWSALEPGTAHPLQRLRAVRQLRDAGVNVGVLMAPVVPGFMTQPDQLEATIKAIADHGAAFIGANVMYLKGGTRDHFLGFIRSEFPQMLEGFERLYAGPTLRPATSAGARDGLDAAEALRPAPRRQGATRGTATKRRRRKRRSRLRTGGFRVVTACVLAARSAPPRGQAVAASSECRRARRAADGNFDLAVDARRR